MLRGWLVALGVLLVAPSAAAFSYETPASKGCHEEITGEALRAVRSEGRAPPLAFARDERALAEDVPFTIPGGLNDLGGVTLIIGVRDNDLRGRGPADLETVATLHGDDALQQQHCLRRAGQDGAAGNTAAVADCRAFIKAKMIAAIDALDARSLPNPAMKTDVKVSLSLRGIVTAPLPTFYVRMGEGLHTMQDAFTHTLRTDDGAEIKTVLNWVEHVAHELDEGRDGPPHLSPLDRCDNRDEIRTKRRQWATVSSTELLRAVLNPALDREGKIAEVDKVLDRWLGIKAGCTAANKWCDAPELNLREEGCSCSSVGRSGNTVVALSLASIALLALFTRRRALALSLLLFAAPARAEEAEKGPEKKDGVFNAPCPEPPKKAEDESSVAKGTKKVLGDPSPNFGLQAAAGASFDSTALAASLAARFRLGDRWLTGVDVEWNPWGSPLSKVRAGTLNVYATGIKRWSMGSDTYALRTTLNAGASRMLFDLYGAPSGTTGLFFGFSFLGLEAKLGRGMTMIFDPAHFALPVPQLRGLFGYPQYRFTIALQWGASAH